MRQLIRHTKILPASLSSVRQKRGLTVEDLASLVNRSTNFIEKLESGDKEPSISIAKSICKQLSIPEYALGFEADNASNLIDVGLPDFRTVGNRSAQVGPKAAAAIDVAKGIRDLAGFAQKADSDRRDFSRLDTISTSDDGEKVASEYRRLLGFSDELQLSNRERISNYYTLRSRIENLGLFVIQRNYPRSDSRAFILGTASSHPVICINISDKFQPARTFSLLHEFCHGLLRKEGISDYEIVNNEIERYCNRWAAYFLMPANLMHRLAGNKYRSQHIDWIAFRNLARRLQVSQHTLSIQLTQLELAPSNFFQTWRDRRGNVAEEETPTGGGADFYKNKVYEWGTELIQFLHQAINDGRLDALEVFRVTRLKPEHISRASEYAKERSLRALSDEY